MFSPYIHNHHGIAITKNLHEVFNGGQSKLQEPMNVRSI